MVSAADLAVAPADKDALVNVAKGNLEELKLSEVAQTAGSNASVKSFAKTMLDAHTKMMNELFDGTKGFAIDGGIKDSNHILKLANDVNAPMPVQVCPVY